MNDGGIAIHTNAELSIGTQAKIEFVLLSYDFPLTLRGVVRNRAGNQYGVEFLVTSAAEQEHLIPFGEILRRKAGCFDAFSERWSAEVNRNCYSLDFEPALSHDCIERSALLQLRVPPFWNG